MRRVVAFALLVGSVWVSGCAEGPADLEDVPVEKAYHKVCVDGTQNVVDDKECEPAGASVAGTDVSEASASSVSVFPRYHWWYVMRETHPSRPLLGTHVAEGTRAPVARVYSPSTRSWYASRAAARSAARTTPRPAAPHATPHYTPRPYRATPRPAARPHFGGHH